MEYLFETERLRMRKFAAEDAQELYAIHSEAEVNKWIPNESYADMEETKGAIRFFADCVDKGRLPWVLAIELKASGAVIGDVGINETKEGALEIGYVIGRRYSGKGYATESVKAMTRFVYSAFGAKVVYGRVLCGNDPSVRVLEKSGYAFVEKEFGAQDDPYGNGMLTYKSGVI